MKNEFDFIDLYYLNDISSPAPKADFSMFEDKEPIDNRANYIKISDEGEVEGLTCTYAKFLEILDHQGVEGLINA